MERRQYLPHAGTRRMHCSGVGDDFFSAFRGTHGTHVAGILAAVGGNAMGVVGVVPRLAGIYGFNALPNDGEGTLSVCLSGLMACEAHLDSLKAAVRPRGRLPRGRLPPSPDAAAQRPPSPPTSSPHPTRQSPHAPARK